MQGGAAGQGLKTGAMHSTGLRGMAPGLSTLEATQGQNGSFFSQLPYKCYLEEVASVED